MKNWILKIHLYGGLLCFWYLLIFGISSLFYQHHFGFMKTPDVNVSEKRVAVLRHMESDSAMARQIMDTLQISGWYLFWKTYRDSSNNFYTQIENPKNSYAIKYEANTQALEVSRSYKGIWSIINSLHGFAGKMPRAPLMIFWSIYTYVCLFVVIFSIISGIWLFALSRVEKKVGWITFSSILACSLLFMIYIYYNG